MRYMRYMRYTRYTRFMRYVRYVRYKNTRVCGTYFILFIKATFEKKTSFENKVVVLDRTL